MNSNQISDMVEELLSEIKNKVKVVETEQVTEQTSAETPVTESELASTESVEVKTESVESRSIPKQVDMTQMNKLFSGLIKSFIPSELKENQDVKKMFDLFFPVEEKESTLAQDVPKENVDGDEENVDGDDENVDGDEEDGEEDGESASASDDDESESASDESPTKAESESECNCVDECDCIERTRESEETKYVYVISQDQQALGYTKSYKKAERFMESLYQSLLQKNCDLFLRTDRSIGWIRVYERKTYALFPFQDTVVSVFTIQMIPKVHF